MKIEFEISPEEVHENMKDFLGKDFILSTVVKEIRRLSPVIVSYFIGAFVVIFYRFQRGYYAILLGGLCMILLRLVWRVLKAIHIAKRVQQWSCGLTGSIVIDDTKLNYHLNRIHEVLILDQVQISLDNELYFSLTDAISQKYIIIPKMVCTEEQLLEITHLLEMQRRAAQNEST
ncbi:hypothetical protein [Catalinimonas alkaloidigena]|uniref:hypothetical protein n=1 Tax=Catalinimonas alkaloidigena TaxID=1075417 RepID=UPI000B80260B|nr:hypothetical protein [Catalinimonas alkaloidigena]